MNRHSSSPIGVSIVKSSDIALPVALKVLYVVHDTPSGTVISVFLTLPDVEAIVLGFVIAYWSVTLSIG